MKDSRFIELVNLYVDRQISAVETTELETEIQANPGRRAVYHQYCQMQRATTLVYGSFRTDPAGAPAATTPTRATIARFEGRERRRQPQWAYYAAGLAAACVAAVFVVRVNTHSPVAPQLAELAPAPTQPVKLVASSPLPAPAQPRTGVVSLRGNLSADQDYAAMVTALRQEEQRAFASTQNQSNRVPSLFEDGVFDAQQGSTFNNSRTFRSKQAAGAQTEFTAFQFQR